MATKRRILVPTISGIVAGAAAGAVGTWNIPLGYRIHQFEIVYQDGGAAPQNIAYSAAGANLSNTGGAGGLITDIIVYRNGTPQRTHSSAQLDHLNGLNGSQYQIQQINGTGANCRQCQTIYFAEPWRKDKVDTDALAWSVDAPNGFKTFQISVTLGSAMPATGQLVAYMVVDAPLPPPQSGAQSVKKVYRQQFPASGLQNDITALDAKDGYQVLSFIAPTGAYINKAYLKLNGTIFYENVLREDNVAALTGLGLNPANSTTAGTFCYDMVLDADDPINSALPATAAPWVTLYYSAAASGNVTAMIERLGPLD